MKTFDLPFLQVPHQHYLSVDAIPELKNSENHCRNPGGISDKPWCYTSNPNIRWEYCAVPQCEQTETASGIAFFCLPALQYTKKSWSSRGVIFLHVFLSVMKPESTVPRQTPHLPTIISSPAYSMSVIVIILTALATAVFLTIIILACRRRRKQWRNRKRYKVLSSFLCLCLFMYLRFNFVLKGDGDPDTERPSIRAPAGPTPSKPHVPEGSPSAELKAAGPWVSTQQHPVCQRYRGGSIWTCFPSPVRKRDDWTGGENVLICTLFIYKKEGSSRRSLPQISAILCYLTSLVLYY